MDVNLVVDAVVLGSVYMLFAVGFSLAWGVLDVLNLAHGAIFMAAGMAGYLVTEHFSLSLAPLILLGAFVGAALSVLIEVTAFRMLRNRTGDAHTAELGTVIASVGAGAILVGIGQKITVGTTVSIDTSFKITRHEFLGMTVTNLQVIIVVLAIGLTAGAAWLVARTSFGRSMRGLAADSHACSLLGISPTRVSVTTMAIAGILAGTAGILLGIYQSGLTENIGHDYLMKAFAAVVIGGVGSVWGAALGAYLLAIAEVATIGAGGGQFVDGVAFVTILALLLVRPTGILPAPKWERA